MSGIKLDDNGDIDITNGKMSLTSGSEATTQRIKQRLNFFFQEWFLDKSRGIPYFQQIFVKNPNPAVIDTIFKREVLEDPDVTEIQKWELDLDTATRELTLTMRVKANGDEFDFVEVFGL